MKGRNFLKLLLMFILLLNFQSFSWAEENSGFVNPDPVDCVELYRLSIAQNSLRGKNKKVEEDRRIRALIRKSFKMIPLLEVSVDPEKISHPEVEVASLFQKKKLSEEKQAEEDLIEIAQSIEKDTKYVAQIIRDSTRYSGPALCSRNEVFGELPDFKSLKESIKKGTLQNLIGRDEGYQIVKKWRNYFNQFEGQFLTGMEIEVEFRGFLDAPVLQYIDLKELYKIWNQNFPEEVGPIPPNDKTRVAKELIKFAKYAKKGQIKMEKEGKKITLRTLPLKFENVPFFFHNVNMFWDDGAVEFNNKAPYKNPADMLECLYLLSRGSQFAKDIFNPEYQYENTVSRMNFHISSQVDAKEPKTGDFETKFNAKKLDIRNLSHEFNKLLGLRMVKRGLENEANGKFNDFSPFMLFKRHDISRFRSGYQNLKGILRISPQQHFNRIEVRRHYAGLAQEMSDYIKYINMDHSEAIKNFREEMTLILKEEKVLEHIFYYEPLNLITYRHVIDPNVLESYIKRMEYDDEVIARFLLENQNSPEILKTLKVMASVPVTNPNPWYKNEPMKVMDPVDAVIELYGKKYVQGYEMRRFCLDPNNFGATCFMPDYLRWRDIIKSGATDLPNDYEHVAR